MFNPSSKLGGAELLATLVEQYNAVARLQSFQNQFPLGLLLLRLAQFFCVLQFWDYLNVKLRKVAESFLTHCLGLP